MVNASGAREGFFRAGAAPNGGGRGRQKGAAGGGGGRERGHSSARSPQMLTLMRPMLGR